MNFQISEAGARLQQRSRRLAADFATRAATHDQKASHPLENYAALRRAGFYSLNVPREMGGEGVGLLNYSKSGLYRSVFGQGDWEPITQGLPDAPEVRAITIHPHRPEVVYVATQDCPYRSDDRGDHWECTTNKVSFLQFNTF